MARIEKGATHKGPRRIAGVEERQAGDDLVLYEPTAGRLHVLNATAARVWRLCDGDTDPGDILARLEAEYEVGRDADLPVDVNILLRNFHERGLIEYHHSPGAPGGLPGT